MKNLLILIIITAFTSSCSSTLVSSNKKDSYSTKVNNIVIVVDGNKSSKQSGKFMINLATNLNLKLKENGISSSCFFTDSISSSSKEKLNKQVEKTKAKALLKISHIELLSIFVMSEYNSGMQENGAKIKIELLELNTEDPSWDAVLSAQGVLGISTQVKTSTSKIISQLEKDGLI